MPPPPNPLTSPAAYSPAIGVPVALGVEPQRRRSGQDADAVVVPDRVPVAQALGVVPHAVGVDDRPAGRRGDLQHPPVHVGRHPGHHAPGRGAEPLGPRLAHQLVVAADAARGHQDGLGGVLEPTDLHARGRHAPGDVGGLQKRPPHPRDGACAGDQRVDAVAEAQPDAPRGGVLADPALEGRHHAGAGAPRQVEPRDRVAVPVGATVTALRPPHDGEEPMPHLPQPRPLLPGREVEVRRRPATWPVVLGAVELRGTEPVLRRQLQRVLDPGRRA